MGHYEAAFNTQQNLFYSTMTRITVNNINKIKEYDLVCLDGRMFKSDGKQIVGIVTATPIDWGDRIELCIHLRNGRCLIWKFVDWHLIFNHYVVFYE